MVVQSFLELNYNEKIQKNIEKSLNSTLNGKANGTFGELLQGVLPNNEHFLVTLPISCCTKCSISPNMQSESLEVYPEHKKKSLKLAENILRYFQLNLGGRLIIESDIAEGKGLASSSADLIATIRAFEELFEMKMSNELIFHFLREIEPSDGVMFPGIVSFYHKKVELIEYLGTIPTMAIVAFDEGGTVDTIEYNKQERVYSEKIKDEYECLLKKISNAVKISDLFEIGKIATRSALLNQAYNPKKYLFEVIDICLKIKALGVAVAHSGTYLGILIDMRDFDFNKKIEEAKEQLRVISSNCKVYKTIP